MTLAEKKLEVLKNIGELTAGAYLHKEIITERSGWEGSYDEYYLIYDVGLGLGNFLKLTYQTDSYGDEDTLTGIDFVQAKEKTVTVYEF